ncbi:MAG: sugar ABC transporter permease, partial [Chloroflexi bacterium]
MSQTVAVESHQNDQSNVLQRTKWRKTLRSAITGYLYLAPTLIILTIFVYIPIVTSFQMSTQRVAP